MKSPIEYDWQFGKLPKVEDVPYDCIIILWNKDYIGWVRPNGDNLNPLRWCDNGRFPEWGIDSPEGWWTWYEKGSKPRPPEVKTWAEMYETPEILAWKKHLENCKQCHQINDLHMRLALSSKIRASDIKDPTPDFCTIGQELFLNLAK